jgi:hypothetical protein
MIINYDNLGIVSELFIELSGLKYQLPFNPESKQLNWELIENQATRALLQSEYNTWADSKDVQHELRDLPSQDIASFKVENWEGWNSSIFRDATYNRLVQTASDQVARVRLESLSLRRFFQPEMILFWNQFINSVPMQNKPTLDEINVWRNAVEAYSMPFDFDDNGLMFEK